MPENSDYKDYFFNHAPRKEFSDVPEELNNPEIYEGLNADQAFQLLVAIVAAEEGAHIIAESIRRTTLAETYPAQVVDVAGEPVAIPAPREKIWVSRKYNADTSIDKTITGGRQMLELTGPGRVIEVILIADVNTIGMQVTVDGDIMYDGSYATLSEITKPDTRLSVYEDQDINKYVIRVANLGFQDRFVLVVTSTGTVEFSTVRCNYDLLLDI